ncbi:MAG TPA: hypothetical protein VF613_13610 [Longimicrobium sp.]|jgi:hypothetical protein
MARDPNEILDARRALAVPERVQLHVATNSEVDPVGLLDRAYMRVSPLLPELPIVVSITSHDDLSGTWFLTLIQPHSL